MAELTEPQIELVWTEATHVERIALYACRNVDAGDTVNVSREFRVVKQGGIVRTSGNPSAATITGTVITFPTGLTDDGVWLLLIGVTV